MPVNTKLQIKDSAIAESIDLLEPFKLTTKNMRNNSGFYHTKWYGIPAGPVSNVHIVKTKVVIQRICSQSFYCQNTQVKSNSNYSAFKVTMLLLYHLMSDLEMNFPGNKLKNYWKLHMISYIRFFIPNILRKKVFVVPNSFFEDLPSINCIDSVLDLWLPDW